VIYERIREATGWTYPQIAGLTLPQMRNVLTGGVVAPPRITGKRAMKAVLERFKRGEFR
jgi:hypothetical protein